MNKSQLNKAIDKELERLDKKKESYIVITPDNKVQVWEKNETN